METFAVPVSGVSPAVFDQAAIQIRSALEQIFQSYPQSLTPIHNAPLGSSKALPRALYDMRRLRDKKFPDLFADASWDILLDLYDNHTKGRPVSVTSACIAASVPATTALRHLKILIERGILARTPCARDARVAHLEFTPAGFNLMQEWISDTLGILTRWTAISKS